MVLLVPCVHAPAYPLAAGHTYGYADRRPPTPGKLLIYSNSICVARCKNSSMLQVRALAAVAMKSILDGPQQRAYLAMAECNHTTKRHILF